MSNRQSVLFPFLAALLLLALTGCSLPSLIQDEGTSSSSGAPQEKISGPKPVLSAAAIAGATRSNSTDGAEMVIVPAGDFAMGDDDSEPPGRTVSLDAFWIYKTPVTAAQYRKFCQATRREMPPAPSWGWKDDHPVVNVTWHDAAAYAEWAGAHLPTEAQWEKAARGTDARHYPWGNEWDPGKLWCSKKTFKDAGLTAPVGSYPAGSSPYGCLDMEGNVGQWCADWYDEDYPKSAPSANPSGPESGAYRVVRGGSWRGIHLLYVDNFRCEHRGNNDPDGRFDDTGFRCVIPG